MTIKVLFFAGLARQLQARELELEVPPAATVADALQQLTRRFPSLTQAQGTLAFAVDMAYVKRDHVLQPGCELALIPPVSGG